jgi:hypothetical protein
MQREELSDSRNRQAAPRNEGQNEGQIWQRDCQLLPDVRARRCTYVVLLVFVLAIGSNKKQTKASL